MAKKFGFTLAEVLITLGIIGVVAAMTIPTLMNQTGQAEFKAGFKKMVSTLNQAVTMNVALDSTDFSALTTSATTTDSASLYAMFKNRMNVISTATDAAGIGASTSNFTLFFNDGSAVSWTSASTACTTAAPCYALVDVNGSKKPNKLTTSSTTTTSGLVIGDQFGVTLQNQQVLPHGVAAQLVMFN